MLLFISNLF